MRLVTCCSLNGKMARARPPRPRSRGRVERELAGPESVAWKLNQEIVLLVGWGAAILMQFAHPLVAAGVADHSQFMANRRQRARRLHQTLRAMLELSFGDADAVCRAARGINAIHDRVHGELREPTGAYPGGTPYSAHDPALLRWVHATLLETFPRAYELFVGPLTAEEKDRYCAEAAGLAPLLGIPDDYLPASTAALADYLRAILADGQIVVGPTARRLAYEVLHPPVLRRIPPLLWLVQLPAIGLLPPDLREAYGFAWGRKEALALRCFAAAVRAALRVTPPLLRHWPAASRARARWARRRREAPAIERARPGE